MAYILTQNDIDRFGLIDAMVGDAATAADLQKMGLGTLPKRDTPTIDPETTDIALTALQATNPVSPIQMEERIVQPRVEPPASSFTNIAPTPKAVTAPSAMMSLLDQSISQDPFENLSKNQRTMLAFAAIKDAGMALQGKEGTAFSGTLTGFRERSDMERKRQAALAQRQMLGTFLSGSAAGTLDPQSIINAMAVGALDPAAGTAMLNQIEKLRVQKAAEEGIVAGGAGALEDLNRLTDMISTGGMVTGFTGWLFNKIPFSEARAARNVADTLRSGMALGALRELKAGGATLGSVSEKELDLLESAIAKLDLNLDRDQVMAQMATIEKHYKDAVRRAYNKASEDEKRGFDGYFAGTTPAWVLDPSAPDPTKIVDPTIEDLSEEEKRRLGL
jgi:hypothetical protein